MFNLKYSEIEWSLPLLFYYNYALGAIRRLIKDDLRITVFGSPACKWTGGRYPTEYKKFSEDELDSIFKYINLNGGTPALTFSSVNLNKSDFDDKYCNRILDVAKNYNCKFIIFDDKLRDYIRKNNPNAVFVASVIKTIFEFQDINKKKTIKEETKYYNKLLDSYDIVVVRPEYSKNYLLDSLDSIHDISRLEILINQSCIYNCPKAISDYKFIELLKENDGTKEFKCYRDVVSLDYYLNNNVQHNEELLCKLVYSGIKHLKLQGRSMNIGVNELLLHLLHYILNDVPSFRDIQEATNKENIGV